MIHKKFTDQFGAGGNAGGARAAARIGWLAAAWIGFAALAFAGTSNSIPFSDTFEEYPNGTPLVNGTNGWYASTNDVVAQNEVYYSGGQAAKIPADTTLSNRFVSSANTSVYVQADVRMVFTDDDVADSTNEPHRTIEVDDPNVAALLYMNTSGYFVVHNGVPDPTTTNSQNWVPLTNAPATARAEGDWVRLLVHLNYTDKKWSLAADAVELTNNIGFVGPGSATSFLGFALYNGSYTSYLDNVRITTDTPPPDLLASPRYVTNSMMKTFAPPAMSFDYINRGGGGPYNYTLTISNEEWLTSTTSSGTLGDFSTNTIPLTFASAIADWAPCSSNTRVTLVTTNNGGVTNWVEVTMNVMGLANAPASYSNSTRKGVLPPTKPVNIVNQGGGSFDFTVTVTNDWLLCATNGGVPSASAFGTLTAFSTGTVYLSYSNAVTNWAEGSPSNTTVIIASTNGGGATNPLSMFLEVTGWGVSNLWYTNNVFLGNQPLTNGQNFFITNRSTLSNALTFLITIPSNNTWLSCSTNSDVIATNRGTNILLLYSNTVGWTTPGASNTTIYVQDADEPGDPPQLVSVTLNLMDITLNPAAVTTMVMKGSTAPGINLEVVNPGGGSYLYTVTSTNNFVTNYPVGVLTNDAYTTNTIALTFPNTTAYAAGAISNTTLKVWSTNGGGRTNFLPVTIEVMNIALGATNWITNTVFTGRTPPDMDLVVSNSGVGTFGFAVTNTTNIWLGFSTNAGTLSSYAGTNITLQFSNTAGWVANTRSNTTILVTSADGGGQTQTLGVAVLVMDMQLGQTNITNVVWLGKQPTNQTFIIKNAGTGMFNYAVSSSNNEWVSCTTNVGVLGSNATSRSNTLTLVYSNTAGFSAGASNTTITLWSTNGGGATQTLAVTLNVMDMALIPSNISTYAVKKNKPGDTSFTVGNAGPGWFNYVVAISNYWVTNSPVGIRTNTSPNSDLVNLSFTNQITNWLATYSNTYIEVRATNFGGVTNKVYLRVDIIDWGVVSTSGASLTAMSNDVMLGRQPAQQTFLVTNSAGAPGLTCSVASTEGWLTLDPAGVTNLAAGAAVTITNLYASTAGWSPGASSATVNVVSEAGITQAVAVTLNVMRMTNNAPAGGLTNYVMEGEFQPGAQSLVVSNAGPGAFNFAVTSDVAWVIVTPATTAIGDHGASTVTVAYTRVPRTAGTSNAVITVTSTNGGGDTNLVNVALVVTERPSGSGLSFYAATNGPHLEPFTNWATAATNIADVLAIVADGNNVFLSNCAFSLTNTLTITNSINFQGWDTNAASTILAGAGASNCLVVNSTGAFVSGMTIQNGQGGPAGGVYLVNGGTLSNCWIAANTSEVGGVLASATNARLIGCVVSGNVGNIVGGLDLQGGVIRDSTIVGNVSTGAAGSAGGLAAGGGLASNCVVAANTSLAYAGGMVASNNALVIGCVVSGNVGNVVGGLDLQGAVLRDSTNVCNVSTGAAGYGGGVALGPQAANLVSNCVIQANAATNTGGGAAMVGGEMVNCSVMYNTQSSAGGAGGGITVMGTNAEQAVMIRNCWIASNAAAASGGGVLFINAPEYSRTLRNCLISSNANDGVLQLEAAAGAGVDLIESCTIATNTGTGLRLLADQGANVLVRNNIMYWNQTNINAELGATTNQFFNNCALYDLASFPTNQGNLTNNPAFVAPAAFNYRLSSSSPCMGAGTNQGWMTNAVDLAGFQRIGGPSVDMGAYEYQWEWVLTSGSLTNDFTLTNSVMLGRTPSIQTFNLVNSGDNALDYVVTNAQWLSGSYSNGTVAAHTTKTLRAVYGSTTSWQTGVSNSTLAVIVTNQGSPQPRTVPVVLQVMDLRVGATNFTDSLMVGNQPTNRTLIVSNSGVGQFDFTATNAAWMSGSATNGSLGSYSNQAINIKYSAAIAGWGPGSSNTAITISSTNGGGATQTVVVTVNMMQLRATPASLTNTVMLGSTPDAQSFAVQNAGGGSFNYAISRNAAWITVNPSSGTLAALGSATITVTYDSTAGWTPGVSNATITAVSTNGGGMTQTVAVVLNVVELPPPTGVAASKGMYTDKIRVEWLPAESATGYQVWRHTENDSVAATLLGVTAETLYDDADPTAAQGRNYYYWLKSTNALGVSAFSDPDVGSRLMPAPTGVSATKREYTDKVRVTWNAVTGALGYQVWRNTENNTATATLKSSPTATTYDDTDAVVETTYYYWVKWTNAYAISGFSSPDTGIRKQEASPAPETPTGLAASQGTYSDKVALTWNAAQYATSYQVWRNTVSDSSSASKIADPTTTSYDDSTVEGGIWYYYWVKGENTSGASAFSAVASGYRIDLTLLPLFGDFDADNRADPAVYQVGTGRWIVKLSGSGYGVAQMRGFGGTGYTAFIADFDGDSKVDLGIYNTTTGDWQVKLSGSGYSTAQVLGFGGAGIVPVTHDFDGDFKADPGIYNTVSGTWRIMCSGSGYGIATVNGFGGTGYSAVSGYYDSDRLTDPAIYGDASGNWQVMLSGSGYRISALPGFGGTGSDPIVADFDGDGRVDYAFYKASTSTWFVKLSASGGALASLSGFGGAGYIAGAIDFDGDGKADPALYQDSTHKWFVKPSTMGYSTVSMDCGYTP